MRKQKLAKRSVQARLDRAKSQLCAAATLKNKWDYMNHTTGAAFLSCHRNASQRVIPGGGSGSGSRLRVRSKRPKIRWPRFVRE